MELLGGLGGEVVEVLMGAFGVEPHHPFSRGGLDLVDVAPGSLPADEFVLERPDSANALSGASPTEPTEGSTPWSMSEALAGSVVQRESDCFEVFCGLRGRSVPFGKYWRSSPLVSSFGSGQRGGQRPPDRAPCGETLRGNAWARTRLLQRTP
jgi:hypothetical protein